MGSVLPEGHPRTFVRPMDIGGDEAMLHVVEGKLSRLTHDVPTLRMDRIPITMQQHVVGVPPSQLFLLRTITRVVLCYHEAVDAVATEEVEENP